MIDLADPFFEGVKISSEDNVRIEVIPEDSCRRIND